MRPVVLQMGTSLDGHVARDRDYPGAGVPRTQSSSSGSWIGSPGPVPTSWARVAYEEMASYWPTSTHRYAAPMDDIPKVVFSRTLEEGSWPITRIASGDLAEEITALKEEPGPDVIACGGASLAAGLVASGLIDEYCLAIQPVAVGQGQALFAELPSVSHPELIDARALPCGVVVHIYRPQERSSS